MASPIRRGLCPPPPRSRKRRRPAAGALDSAQKVGGVLHAPNSTPPRHIRHTRATSSVIPALAHLRHTRARPAPSYPRSPTSVIPALAHLRHTRARPPPSYPRSAAGISPSSAPKPLPRRRPTPARPRPLRHSCAPFRHSCAPFRHSCAGRNPRSATRAFCPERSAAALKWLGRAVGTPSRVLALVLAWLPACAGMTEGAWGWVLVAARYPRRARV